MNKVGMGSTVGPNTMYGERCKKLWPEPCPCMETPLHAADALQVRVGDPPGQCSRWWRVSGMYLMMAINTQESVFYNNAATA